MFSKNKTCNLSSCLVLSCLVFYFILNLHHLIFINETHNTCTAAVSGLTNNDVSLVGLASRKKVASADVSSRACSRYAISFVAIRLIHSGPLLSVQYLDIL